MGVQGLRIRMASLASQACGKTATWRTHGIGGRSPSSHPSHRTPNPKRRGDGPRWHSRPTRLLRPIWATTFSCATPMKHAYLPTHQPSAAPSCHIPRLPHSIYPPVSLLSCKSGSTAMLVGTHPSLSIFAFLIFDHLD